MDNLTPVLHPAIVGIITWAFANYDFVNVQSFVTGAAGVPAAGALGAALASLIMESGLWKTGLSGGFSGNVRSVLWVAGGAFVFGLGWGLLAGAGTSGQVIATALGAFAASGGFHAMMYWRAQ